MQNVVLLVASRDVGDEYARTLGRRYEVRRAEAAAEAVDRIAEAGAVLVSADVAGAGALTTRIYTEGHAAGVGLLTDGERQTGPIPHDEQVPGPADDEGLFRTVECLFERASFSEDLRHHYAVAARLAALESRFGPESAGTRPEYRRLRSTLERLERRLTERLRSFGAEGFRVATGPSVSV